MFTSVHSRALVQFLFCATISLGVGFLVSGIDIFQPGWPSFQFVMSGIIVGVFLGATNYLTLRETFLVAAGVYILILLVDKMEEPEPRISFGVYVLVLYLGTMGGLLSNRLFPRLAVGKFVVWGALFAVLYMAYLPLLGWVLSQPPIPGYFLSNARLGAALGVAFGLANELAELGGAGRQEVKRAPREKRDY
jgi:hypothetical protein